MKTLFIVTLMTISSVVLAAEQASMQSITGQDKGAAAVCKAQYDGCTPCQQECIKRINNSSGVADKSGGSDIERGGNPKATGTR